MSYILGISAFYHDSSATLLNEGNIVGAVQEERFTRIKHDPSFPVNSIKYLLSEAKVSLDDIQAIVFYEKPFLKFERLIETYLAFAPKGFKSFSVSIPIWIREKLFQKQNIYKELQKIEKNFKGLEKIKFSEHHMSHAASAYFASPFDNALILTLDGVGEWPTTTVSIGKKNNITILKEMLFPHSLGLLYTAFTFYLGFKVNSGEYKVMGLAPYGSPKYKNLILENLIHVKNDGSFRLNMKFFDFATGLKMTNKYFDKLFGKKKRIGESEELTQFHMDIASSIQAVTEEIILKICRSIKNEYNSIDNLCLSGGVALNCVVNGKILKEKIFKNIWIQPASGDAGGSLGAALAYWHINLKNKKINNFDIMKGSYLGPRFNDTQIEIALLKSGAKFKKLNEDSMINEISEHLKNGNIIGWFQGRMEFGPRALGGRSIIADPRSETMQKTLNLKIKFRESFRPFAPSILREKIYEYFNIDIDSPYMLLVGYINESFKVLTNEKNQLLFGIEKLNLRRSSIPAVTHLDYSSRIQTVHRETNQKYFKLLKKFDEKTNCPVLINTSFNVRGEPIVCSPEDAFNCFMGTDLDFLVIENFVLDKKEQDPSLMINYKKKYKLD